MLDTLVSEIKTLWDVTPLFIQSAIGAIGGVAFLVKFFSNTIISLILKNIDSKNTKELEGLKSTLGNKQYISKVQFDAEFSIYRELSSAFFDAVFYMNKIISQELLIFNQRIMASKEAKEKAYEVCAEKVEIAKDTLYKNAPFIDGEIYNSYLEILEIVSQQIIKFACSNDLKYSTKIFEVNSLTEEDTEITSETIDKLDKINNKIRTYLKTLEVIE